MGRMLAAWWNQLEGTGRRDIFLRTDGFGVFQVEARDAGGSRFIQVADEEAGRDLADTLMRPVPGQPPQTWAEGRVKPAPKGAPTQPPYVEPQPYPEGDAPFGGQPIDFAVFIRIYGRQVVRRWNFHGKDPHHHHNAFIRSLPDGRFSLDATADRLDRVWLFPTQPEAEAAADRMRAALWWPGEWSEVRV